MMELTREEVDTVCRELRLGCVRARARLAVEEHPQEREATLHVIAILQVMIAALETPAQVLGTPAGPARPLA